MFLLSIDNLADIVAGLSSVKRHLRDIQDQTLTVQDKVGQLKLGLGESKNRLIGSLFWLVITYLKVHTFIQKINIIPLWLDRMV